MTMQVGGLDKIAGLSAFEVRRFFRHVTSCHQNVFDRQWLMRYLDLSAWKATQVIRGLVREGYVVTKGRLANQFLFEFTDLGDALARASGAKRVMRSTAAQSLQDFMGRVREVNENPNYLYTVTAVAVFGSYLKDTAHLGDVDVAVRVNSRIVDNDRRVDRELQHARASGRSFSRFIDQLTWAHDEVMLALKARKRTISIQAWDSFVRMTKNPEFRYSVLFGDSEGLRAELKSSGGGESDALAKSEDAGKDRCETSPER
jgi:predicted nucleotidyltransferase